MVSAGARPPKLDPSIRLDDLPILPGRVMGCVVSSCCILLLFDCVVLAIWMQYGMALHLHGYFFEALFSGATVTASTLWASKRLHHKMHMQAIQCT